MTRLGRHIPRLCQTCGAPMAGQEDTCWQCGAVWVDQDRRDDQPGGPSGIAVRDSDAESAAVEAGDAVLIGRA